MIKIGIHNGYLTSVKYILYIANCLRWKSSVVVKLNCNLLKDIHDPVAAWYSHMAIPIISLETFTVTNQSANNAKHFNFK